MGSKTVLFISINKCTANRDKPYIKRMCKSLIETILVFKWSVVQSEVRGLPNGKFLLHIMNL